MTKVQLKSKGKVKTVRLAPISINKGIRRSLDRYKKEIKGNNPDMHKISDALAVEVLIRLSGCWVEETEKKKKSKKHKKTRKGD